MNWYKHEASMHDDNRVRKLIIKYGLRGYGLYNYCIELILPKISPLDYSCRLDQEPEILAHIVGEDKKEIEEILQYIVELGLFENNNGHFFCPKILKRIATYQTSNPEMREILGKVGQSHDSIMTHHDSVMTPSYHNTTQHKQHKEHNTHTSADELKKYCIKFHDTYHEDIPTTLLGTVDSGIMINSIKYVLKSYPPREIKSSAVALLRKILKEGINIS
jgi:hypothetical protein